MKIEIKEIVLEYLEGKEVRGMYFGDGNFSGDPDCYKFQDISKALDKIEIVFIKNLELSKAVKFEVLYYDNHEEVKKWIKSCEGKHIQQIAYSSFHDALTQVCFICEKVRTSLGDKELKK